MIKQLSENKKVMFGAVAALIALQAVLWVPDTLDRAVWDKDKLQAMDDSVRFLDKHLPEDSILIVDRQLGETLQYYPKWDLLDASVISRSRSRRGRRGLAGRGAARRDPNDADEDPNDPPDRASPMQRGKADILRKAFNAVSGDARTALIASHLEELRARHKGGIYWITGTGGGTLGRLGRRSSGRSAMRRFDFKDGRRFKFVDSVTLSITTEARERKEYVEEYEKQYGEPPPTRRRGRGGLAGLFRGRGNGARRRMMGGMFGPRSGSKYRLYKLADRGETVAVAEIEAADEPKAADPTAAEAAAKKNGGEAVDAKASTTKKGK